MQVFEQFFLVGVLLFVIAFEFKELIISEHVCPAYHSNFHIYFCIKISFASYIKNIAVFFYTRKMREIVTVFMGGVLYRPANGASQRAPFIVW